jgi:hypothetical protein
MKNIKKKKGEKVPAHGMIKELKRHIVNTYRSIYYCLVREIHFHLFASALF